MSNRSADIPGTDTARPRTSSPLNPVRLIASAVGAVLSAVVLSQFGVAGTITGAALGSIVATIGTELNQRYLDKSAQHLQKVGSARLARFRRPGPSDGAPSDAEEVQPGGGDTRRRPAWLHWKAMAAFGLAGFLAAMLLITGFELAAGRPLAAVVGGSDDPGRSTTVGEIATGGGGQDPDPQQAPSPSDETATTTDADDQQDPDATTTSLPGVAPPSTTTPPGSQPVPPTTGAPAPPGGGAGLP